MRRITLRVKGRGYLHYTLVSWLREVKDILEDEYDVDIEILEEEGDETPEIYMGNIKVLEGLPEEEGYLIEELKHILDRILWEKL